MRRPALLLLLLAFFAVDAGESWWRSAVLGARGFSSCRSLAPAYDSRAKCAARALDAPALSEADAAALVGATERAAQRRGGYTSERHESYPTTDLPLATVLALGFNASSVDARRQLERALDAALAAVKRELAHRCGAREAELRAADTFVIRYGADGQRALRAHTDGSRFSATVTLSRGSRIGWRRDAGGADPAAACAADCRGETVDAWHREHGVSCDELAGAEWSCDVTCSAACGYGGVGARDATVGQDEPRFGGGGTRFGPLVLLPPAGGAVAHGGKLRHAAAPVAWGERYVLAYFLEEESCERGLRFAQALAVGAAGALALGALAWGGCASDFEPAPAGSGAKKAKAD